MPFEERVFNNNDIEKITRGWADKRMLQNRHGRDGWLTPINPPPPGKSYPYRWPHVVEVILVTELVWRGFTHESATAAIKHRLRAAFMKGGGYAQDHKSRLGDLPEIDGRECYWVMQVRADEKWGLVPSATIACWTPSEIGEPAASAGGAFVLNVGDAIQAAMKRVKLAGTR